MLCRFMAKFPWFEMWSPEFRKLIPINLSTLYARAMNDIFHYNTLRTRAQKKIEYSREFLLSSMNE